MSERPAARAIVALSLTASLAAFGCTTNRTPGNGDPYRSGPGVGPTTAPTSGVTGTSSGSTAVPDKPMMSSSTYVEALPAVTTRAKRLPLSPDEAAAVMAGQTTLNRGVRVLGPVNPGPSQSQGIAMSGATTLQAGNTVNAVGVGGTAAPIVSANDVSGVPVGATGVNGTAIITPTAATGGTIATPTNAALPFSAGAFAAGPGVTAASPTGVITATNTTLTPSAVSGAVPSPTATSGAVINPGTAPTVSRQATTPRSSTATNSAATTTPTVTGAGATTAATTVGPTRTVISNANGTVTATSSGKSQQ